MLEKWVVIHLLDSGGKTHIRRSLQSAGLAQAHPLQEGIQPFITVIQNIHISPQLCTSSLLTHLFATAAAVWPFPTE